MHRISLGCGSALPRDFPGASRAGRLASSPTYSLGVTVALSSLAACPGPVISRTSVLARGCERACTGSGGHGAILSSSWLATRSFRHCDGWLAPLRMRGCRPRRVQGLGGTEPTAELEDGMLYPRQRSSLVASAATILCRLSFKAAAVRRSGECMPGGAGGWPRGCPAGSLPGPGVPSVGVLLRGRSPSPPRGERLRLRSTTPS